MEHAAHAGHSPPATTHNVNFQLDRLPVAGAPCELSFVLTERPVGDPLEAFEPLHDRFMHLIIVDETLSYFDHVHPILMEGAFKVSHTFPNGGKYKLWAEAKPAGAPSVLAAFRLTVASGLMLPVSDTNFAAGYRVSLSPSGSLPLHEPVELTFDIADPYGQPVKDLEPLMAAGGHCVIISSDLRDFLHVHPLQDVDAAWRGGPNVKFLTSFHRPEDLGTVPAPRPIDNYRLRPRRRGER
jgi:hypothetical protein